MMSHWIWMDLGDLRGTHSFDTPDMGHQVAMDSEGIICGLCADPLREVFKAAARSSVNPPSWADSVISTKVFKTVGGTTPFLCFKKIRGKDGEKTYKIWKKHEGA